MTDITPFDFHGHSVRVIPDSQGEPWFVASDVTAVLGYVNGRDALSRLPERMKNTVAISDGTPGNPNRTVVNEAGVNRLIMRSNLPEAERFQDWLAEDVIPAIRRHGGYLTPHAVEAALTDPDFIIRLATDLKEERARVAALTPRAEAFDSFLSTTGDVSVNEAAKILSRDRHIMTGEKRLRDWMHTHGWLYRDGDKKPRAYQTRIDQGVLAEKAQWHYHPETGEKVMDAPQVRVTAKGIDALAKALTKKEIAG